ncbi:uncharacterized protein [Drosophila tropicalis]|uniref:uncharacterized protein n=1 Tax=Drosophila tropicalis TaxID=46794 RepID=UPI0035ABBE9C
MFQRFVLLVVIVFVGSITGFSTQYRGNARHPTLPDHCYYEELDMSIALNATSYPVDYDSYCVKVHCRDDYVLMIRHCDRMQLPNGCSFTSNDYAQPYPDCCARLVCSNRS